MVLGFIASNAITFENYFLEALEPNNPKLKSICLLIKNIWLLIQRINKYNLKGEYFDKIIKEIKKIKTKKEFKEKTIFENLLGWDGNVCENNEEQEITFLEQRVLLQNEHKNFFENTETDLLKIPGIKTKLEELIPNFKLKYFVKNDIFNDNNELNEHFYLIIFGENKNVFLRNILEIKYFVSAKNINNEIKNLKLEKNELNKLEGLWKEIRPKISSKYDSLFVIEFEELKKEENKILFYLKEKINKIYLLIKKLNKNKKIPEWIENNDLKEFNECLNYLMFNEFKKIILEKNIGKTYLNVIKSENAKDRLNNLFGSKDYANEIYKILENIQIDEEEKENLEEESFAKQKENKKLNKISSDELNIENEDLLENKLENEEKAEILLQKIIEEEINKNNKLIKDGFINKLFLDNDDKKTLDYKLTNKLMFDKWNKDNNQLSRLLITNNVNIKIIEDYSKIEGIILLENEFFAENNKINLINNYFFGKYLCNENQRNNCLDSSIYCFFCKNNLIKNLYKSFNGCPLIKFKLNNLNIKIKFVLIPNDLIKLINNFEQTKRFIFIDRAIQIFIEKFSNYLNPKDVVTNMVYNLSDYRSNQKIMQILNISILSKERYKFLIVLLRLWCKKNSIFGNNFGFLNNNALIILAYHLISKNPNLSFRKILEEFHKIFENEFLIKILEEEKNEIIWNFEKEKEFRQMESLNEKNKNPGWAILTLGYPKYNSLIKINKSTAKIIKLISKIGFDKLINLKKAILDNSSEEILNKKWLDWLGNEKLFSQLYENFLLINCSYLPSSLHGFKFCEFIETQLRIEMIENIEKVDEIEYCHIKPLKLLNCLECPKEMGKKLKGWICTSWLIGIKLKNIKINKELLNEKIKIVKENLKNKYLNEIEKLIVDHLEEDFVTGIKYIEKDNLPNW